MITTYNVKKIIYLNTFFEINKYSDYFSIHRVKENKLQWPSSRSKFQNGLYVSSQMAPDPAWNWVGPSEFHPWWNTQHMGPGLEAPRCFRSSPALPGVGTSVPWWMSFFEARASIVSLPVYAQHQAQYLAHSKHSINGCWNPNPPLQSHNHCPSFKLYHLSPALLQESSLPFPKYRPHCRHSRILKNLQGLPITGNRHEGLNLPFSFHPLLLYLVSYFPQPGMGIQCPSCPVLPQVPEYALYSQMFVLSKIAFIWRPPTHASKLSSN